MNKPIKLMLMSLSLVVGLTSNAALKAQERADGMRFVPNVVDQFNSLTKQVDPLNFRIGPTPNPSECRHYQGLARVRGGGGTPF
ncbi:MAG: hypothetical protein DRR06_16655, partial [Gammaproteobacteria bacterium]